MHSNDASLFTDCPHREKSGWLEETDLVASGLLFSSDLEGLYRANGTKYYRCAGCERYSADDCATLQALWAGVSDVRLAGVGFGDGAGSVVEPPVHGDRDVFERNYATMQRYVTYLEGRALDCIVAYGLGDWYDIGPNPFGFSQDTALGVTGRLMLYEDARVMARIATLLGKPEDEQR
jgi:alpha-L-rhamnosidase